MRRTLGKQIEQRNLDLPNGMSQMVMLDVRGRGYTREFLKGRIEDLEREFTGVPFDVIRG